MKFDTIERMFLPFTQEKIAGVVVVTALIIIVAFIASFFLKQALQLILSHASGYSRQGPALKRSLAASKVLKNTLDAIIIVIAFITILSQWGVDVAPLLTGAGIMGLAVSFGAQSLVKDFLSGFFILFEGQFAEGDSVEVNGQKGTVTKMTLRLTVLKDEKGNLIYFPNSQITKVVKLKA